MSHVRSFAPSSTIAHEAKTSPWTVLHAMNLTRSTSMHSAISRATITSSPGTGVHSMRSRSRTLWPAKPHTYFLKIIAFACTASPPPNS